MGIKGLTKQIKKMAPSAIKTMSYEDLAAISTRKVYGVDVLSYLYPTQYNSFNKSKGNHIREFMEMITTWASHGIRLIFVFDGNTNSDAKRGTTNQRADKRIKGQAQVQRLINEILDTEPLPDMSKDIIINTDLNKHGHAILSSSKGTMEQRIELEHALRSHTIVSGDNVNDLITLFQLVGATYMRAQGEADFLLATLYKNGYIDGVISEDCDMLTHGVDRLIRGINDSSLRRVGHVSVYCLSDILDGAKISNNQFIDYCILCGCDYGPKIADVAGGVGLKLLRKHTNINNIISCMNDNSIKYRPANGISIEEYQFQYERAFRIFSKDQEPLPEFTLMQYAIGDGFEEWILAETNYTRSTLKNKIQILQSPKMLEQKPVVLSNPTVGKTTKTKTKIKATIKPKAKAKAKPIPIKIKLKNTAS